MSKDEKLGIFFSESRSAFYWSGPKHVAVVAVRLSRLLSLVDCFLTGQ